MLARHFLNQARALVPGGATPTISGEAMRALEAHDWPGNLRELRHEMQRALVMAQGRAEILADDLSPSLRRAKPIAKPPTNATLEQKIDALEIEELSRAMRECNGNKTRAAEMLGLSRQGLLNKLSRHGLKG
jgi:DNA-binding NtrC family response regulator